MDLLKTFILRPLAFQVKEYLNQKGSGLFYFDSFIISIYHLLLWSTNLINLCIYIAASEKFKVVSGNRTPGLLI